MITFTLTPQDVHDACERNNWFTQGTLADYYHMLNEVQNHGTNVADFQMEELILSIGSEIFSHSDIDVRQNIDHALLNACKLSIVD